MKAAAKAGLLDVVVRCRGTISEAVYTVTVQFKKRRIFLTLPPEYLKACGESAMSERSMVVPKKLWLFIVPYYNLTTIFAIPLYVVRQSSLVSICSYGYQE